MNRNIRVNELMQLLVRFRTCREQTRFKRDAWDRFDDYLCRMIDSSGGDSNTIDEHGNPIWEKGE